jgi:hypothetical protein
MSHENGQNGHPQNTGELAMIPTQRGRLMAPQPQGHGAKPPARRRGRPVWDLICEALDERDGEDAAAVAQAFVAKCKSGSFPHLKELIDRQSGRVLERVRHDVTLEANARPSFSRHLAPQIELTPEERAESAGAGRQNRCADRPPSPGQLRSEPILKENGDNLLDFAVTLSALNWNG